MSYALSGALQSAIYQHLSTDSALNALVGAAIYDAMPPGTVPSIYVALGPETAKDWSSQTSAGASHEFTLSVVTQGAGFSDAKRVAAAICDALSGADISLSRGRLVALNFMRAKAVRIGTADERRIDLTFHALVEDA